MSRFTVGILPDAEAELRAAFLWHFEKSPLAADAFRTEVFEAIDSLAETALLIGRKMKTERSATTSSTFRTP